MSSLDPTEFYKDAEPSRDGGAIKVQRDIDNENGVYVGANHSFWLSTEDTRRLRDQLNTILGEVPDEGTEGFPFKKTVDVSTGASSQKIAVTFDQERAVKVLQNFMERYAVILDNESKAIVRWVKSNIREHGVTDTAKRDLIAEWELELVESDAHRRGYTKGFEDARIAMQQEIDALRERHL